MEHPLTRDADLDSASSLELRYEIIRRKPFLQKIYRDWYGQLVAALPSGGGRILEIGTGGGFLRERVPDLITSDVLAHRGVDLALDALTLPVAEGALRAIVMIDVLHHLPQPRRFFAEAGRCVRSGGAVLMIEPWVTTWSRFVYGKLHHEPFRPAAQEWEFPSTGPLSGANGALPWMLFERDRVQFEREFPAWGIDRIEVQMPFRYLLSGGVSMRSLVPAWTSGFWRGCERALRPWMRTLGMFAFIALRRQQPAGRTTA